jgi:hypothetical protein
MYLPDGLLTAEDKKVKHCPQGTYKETWQRVGIAGCLPCGVGDWLSDRTIFLNDLDPNTGLVRQQIGVRGSTDSCCECDAVGSYQRGDAGLCVHVLCHNSIQLPSHTALLHGLYSMLALCNSSLCMPV